MFESPIVGILVLAAAFTVGLLIGWRFWGAAARAAADDKRDLERDVQNERRKHTAIEQQRDDAKTELSLASKRVSELEAQLAAASTATTASPASPAPETMATASDDGALKAQLEAAEKARAEAEARAQLAEARALEAERRVSEAEARAKGAEAARARSEIDEAKAKREAEQKARVEAEQKAKHEAEAKAKHDAEAKAKQEAEAKAKADAEAKAKHDAEAKAKKEAEARAKAEAEAKAKKEAETKAKQEAEAKAKQEAEAKAKQEAEAKAKQEAEAKAKPPSGVPEAFWQMFGAKVPFAKGGEKDDLVGGIKGIGPKTGQRLNDLGIFTYAQIAAFDNDVIAKVSEAVGALPGKIEREDWVGQAKAKLKEAGK